MTIKPYDLETICQGIADTITAGIEKSPFYTYVAPSEMGELPCALIEPVMADFMGAMGRGADTYDFIVYVIVSRGDLPTAVSQLSTLLSGDGPDSIRRAIFEGKHLGLGDHVTAFVYGMHNFGGKFPWYDIPHIGAQLLLRVIIN